MQTIAQEIQEKGVSDENIIYFDLDKRGYRSIKTQNPLQVKKKYYLSDLGFYYATNTDNRINYGPVMENVAFVYARSKDYSVSIGRIGKLECDFIFRKDLDYSYLQICMTIMSSKETEEREYRPLEIIKDNYQKYV